MIWVGEGVEMGIRVRVGVSVGWGKEGEGGRGWPCSWLMWIRRLYRVHTHFI